MFNLFTELTLMILIKCFNANLKVKSAGRPRAGRCAATTVTPSYPGIQGGDTILFMALVPWCHS